MLHPFKYLCLESIYLMTSLYQSLYIAHFGPRMLKGTCIHSSQVHEQGEMALKKVSAPKYEMKHALNIRPIILFYNNPCAKI